MNKITPSKARKKAQALKSRYIELLDELERRGMEAPEFKEISEAIEVVNSLFQRTITQTETAWSRQMKEIRRCRGV